MKKKYGTKNLDEKKATLFGRFIGRFLWHKKPQNWLNKILYNFSRRDSPNVQVKTDVWVIGDDHKHVVLTPTAIILTWMPSDDNLVWWLDKNYNWIKDPMFWKNWQNVFNDNFFLQKWKKNMKNVWRNRKHEKDFELIISFSRQNNVLNNFIINFLRLQMVNYGKK